MSDDHKAADRTGISYSYLHRGELPGDFGAFFENAGKTKADFTRVHNAQIEPDVPERFLGRHRQSISNHTLSQPHPSFALPHKCSPDESWLQVLATDDTGKVLSRDAFRKARTKDQAKSKSKSISK